MKQKSYVLPEAKEFKKQFETASWYEMVLVPAGEYPIRYTDIGGREVEPDKSYYGIVKLTGVVTSSYFVNQLFGSSSAKIDELKGETETIILQIYSYALNSEEE